MKKIRPSSMLALTLLVFTLSCSVENENEIKPLSINDQIVQILTKEGYKAGLINNNQLVVSGFDSKRDFMIKINQIYDILDLTERKFDITEFDRKVSAAAKLECVGGPMYDSGGAWCRNYVCSITAAELECNSEEYRSTWDCFGNDCIQMDTSCIE